MAHELLGDSSEFPEGQMKGTTVGGKSLLVARVEGKLYAMDGRCSHMSMDLSKGRIEGPLVTCKLHGAQFDIRTGEVVRNMAAKPMKSYQVVEEGGRAFVEI